MEETRLYTQLVKPLISRKENLPTYHTQQIKAVSIVFNNLKQVHTNPVPIKCLVWVKIAIFQTLQL